MKKGFALLLILVFAMSLTVWSHVSTKTATTPVPTSMPYQQLEYAKRYNLNQLLQSSDIVPKTVMSLYSNYIIALDKINPSLSPADFIDVYDETDCEADCKFGTRLNGGHCDLYITTKNDKIYKWQVSFNMDYDQEYIKDIFAATIMVANNNSITPEDAKNQAQPIADAYPTSKHFNINNYVAYLAHYGGGDMFVFDSLLVFDESNMIPTADELSEYAPLSYETAKNAEMNKGMKDVIHGTVDTYTMDNITQKTPKIYFLFTADDGNQYKLYYDFTKIPHEIETQRKYTFYCTVEKDMLADYDKPTLSVDWYVQE